MVMNMEQQNDNGQNAPLVLDVRHLSQSQFAQLGMPYIAYLKPVLNNGVPAIAIHGADGTPMGVATDVDVAIAAVEQHEMRPVRVH
jgi:hypothetical protein